jgi:uncharacterized domain 1
MIGDEHFRALERMYHRAPCNRAIRPRLEVTRGEAEIRMAVTESMHHAAHAMHGAYFFKMLDDAAFFAANSLVTDVFVLTVSFDLKLLRPVSAGVIVSRGRVVRAGRRLIIAESELAAEDGRLLARGGGVFARSAIRLDGGVGYEIPAGAGGGGRPPAGGATKGGDDGRRS